MFGYVTANVAELDTQQRQRYGEIYCGICQAIGKECADICRLGLRYDMAFLAALLLSLYEPEEEKSQGRCLTHPLKKRPRTHSEIIRYTADMNVALAYGSCLDNWNDEHKLSAKMLAQAMEPHYRRICQAYPRQCGVMERCLKQLRELEKENCPEPDKPAGVFGELMAELFIWKEDMWQDTLRACGQALGRFIYLLDAWMDEKEDRKKGNYNPLIAKAESVNMEQILPLTMSRCTYYYEKLPLVQDKGLLDNILYSGVWVRYRETEKHRKERGK